MRREQTSDAQITDTVVYLVRATRSRLYTVHYAVSGRSFLMWELNGEFMGSGAFESGASGRRWQSNYVGRHGQYVHSSADYAGDVLNIVIRTAVSGRLLMTITESLKRLDCVEFDERLKTALAFPEGKATVD